MSTLSEMLSLRKKRLSLQREADLLEQQEKGLAQLLINDMNSKGLRAYKEGDDEVTVVESTEPVVNNWPELLDYIRENDALDIFQKRVTASAVKARWAENVVIPGVAPTLKQSLKITI